MFPRSSRLTQNFQMIFRKGKVFHTPFFLMRVLPSSSHSRVAVVVSKKVAKKAVDRNRIRRRMLASLRVAGFLEQLSSPLLVVVLPRAIVKEECIFEELVASVEKLRDNF